MNTKWTRADLGTEQKLESLLRKLQKDLTDMEQRNLARIAELRTDLDTQVRSIWSSTTSQVNALQGAISRALAAVPGDISVYDEENNQWISTPDASASQAGIVTTGTQTFAGDKTFQDDVTINGDLQVDGDITLDGFEYFDTQWRFTWSDSHFSLEYYDGAAWGINHTHTP